jgi:hypothetical protein
VSVQPASEASTWSTIGSVKHGYPPPRLSVGSLTTSYCGTPLVVEGEYSDQPPRDACALCALAWESRRKRPRRRRRPSLPPGPGSPEAPETVD